MTNKKHALAMTNKKHALAMTNKKHALATTTRAASWRAHEVSVAIHSDYAKGSNFLFFAEACRARISTSTY